MSENQSHTSDAKNAVTSSSNEFRDILREMKGCMEVNREPVIIRLEGHTSTGMSTMQLHQKVLKEAKDGREDSD